MKESGVNGKLNKYWGKRKEKASKNNVESTTESTVEDTKENKASAFNKVSSLMGRDLLPLTIAKLRTCKEITNFCLINKQSSGMCKGDIFYLLRTILMYKGTTFNYDKMIEKMLSYVIQITSASKPGTYAKGMGMYQFPIANTATPDGDLIRFAIEPAERLAVNLSNGYVYKTDVKGVISDVEHIQKHTQSNVKNTNISLHPFYIKLVNIFNNNKLARGKYIVNINELSELQASIDSFLDLLGRIKFEKRYWSVEHGHDDVLRFEIKPTSLSYTNNLRTVREIDWICETNNLVGSEKIEFIKELIKSRHPELNPDILIYRMMCQLIEVSSNSQPGDYLKGNGMYQKEFDEMKPKFKQPLLDMLNKLSSGIPLSNDDFYKIEGVKELVLNVPLHPFFANNFVDPYGTPIIQTRSPKDVLSHREPTWDSFIDHVIRLFRRKNMDELKTVKVIIE